MKRPTAPRLNAPSRARTAPDHRGPEPGARRARPAAAFTRRDMAACVYRYGEGPGQFNRGAGRHAQGTRPGGAGMCAAASASPRATCSRSNSSYRAAMTMTSATAIQPCRAEAPGSDPVRRAGRGAAHVTDGCSLGIIIGHAGTGMLDAACKTWEAAGLPHRHSSSALEERLGWPPNLLRRPTGNGAQFFRATKTGKQRCGEHLRRGAGRWPLQSSTDLHHYQRLVGILIQRRIAGQSVI